LKDIRIGFAISPSLSLFHAAVIPIWLTLQTKEPTGLKSITDAAKNADFIFDLVRRLACESHARIERSRFFC
jgi:hypothetical protein